MHRFRPRLKCDIFCKVIDNFGDIGVCWRLARQLESDYAWDVQLWVDDLHTFSKLCSAIRPDYALQRVGALQIKHWTPTTVTAIEMGPGDRRADVVIEAFGCELPQQYMEHMAGRHRSISLEHATMDSPTSTPSKPVWINLEYLSAEKWIPDFHAIPSTHPTYPLTKTCFFPGLEKGTGGVLKERGLCKKREAFLQDPAQCTAFWESLGLSSAQIHSIQANNVTRISLFCYENPLLPELLHRWSTHPTPIICFVPQGLILPAVAQFMGRTHLPAGESASQGQLTVYSLPFLTQEHYDQLLWLCTLNFVRGEDSFVRAQWAHRPFIWHIYPQQHGAHLIKLNAALHHYTAHLEHQAMRTLTQFWQAWNGMPNVNLPKETAFWAQLPSFERNAQSWAHSLASVGDLASNLTAFCQTQLNETRGDRD